MPKSKAMNHWYPRYTGDIQRKTSHLSMSQMGAYDRLLDWYYSNQRPLPLDMVQMHRICSAVAASEQADVEVVVTQFFVKEADGWHNKKADEEIQKRQNISEKRRKAQKVREEKRLAKERSKRGAHAPTSTSTSKNDRIPLTPIKSLNGDFDIYRLLDDDGFADARAAAPGRDISDLAVKYNQAIREGKMDRPRYPNRAFPAWCKSAVERERKKL